MSTGNSPNPVDFRKTKSPRIDVGTIVTEVWNDTTKEIEVCDSTGSNMYYTVGGVVDYIPTQAVGSTAKMATAGSTVGIVGQTHIGVRIKCYTACAGFDRTGCYHYLLERINGASGDYQEGITGTLICLKDKLLPAGYVTHRLIGGMRFVREEEDNFFLFRFSCLATV